MKSFRSIITIIASALLLIGIIICISSYFMFFHNSKPNSDYYDLVVDDLVFSSIDFQASDCDVEIVKGDRYLITCENIYGPGLSTSTSNNIIFIRYKSDFVLNIFNWDIGIPYKKSDKKQSKISIMVPEEAYLSTIRLDLGRGAFTADKIESDCVVFQVGLGKLELNQLTVKEDSAIQVGSGKIHIKSFEYPSSEVTCGLGKIDITSGSTSKKEDLKLKSSLGWSTIK